MASSESTIELPVAPDRALDICTRALESSDLGIQRKTTNPATFTVEGITGTSFVSWSEEIKVRVSPGVRAGTSRVTIRSESWQLLDWGKNRTNVERLRERIQELSH
jgi:hypothetical protein